MTQELNTLIPQLHKAITSVDTGNKASNVIPATTANKYKTNDSHSGSSLISWLEEEIDKVSAEYGIQLKLILITGESFITPPGELELI